MNPTIGRIVRFVMPSGPSAGEIRPAIITHVDHENEGTVSLQVFTEPGRDQVASPQWRPKVSLDPEKGRGTWHAPERNEGDQVSADLALLERMEAAAKLRDQMQQGAIGFDGPDGADGSKPAAASAETSTESIRSQPVEEPAEKPAASTAKKKKA